MLRVFMALAAIGLIATRAVPGHAQEVDPLVTDRPDFTESARTVDDGKFQVEAGYTITRTQAVLEHTLGEILLRVGLSPRAELRVGFGSTTWTSGDHPEQSAEADDPSLGVKVAVPVAGEAAGIPEIALLAATTIPGDALSARGVQDRWQPAATLALAWELGERTSLGSNLNYSYALDGPSRFHQASGSLAVGYAWTERTGSYLEVYGFAPSAPNERAVGHINTGLTWLVNSEFQLDARIGTSIGGDPEHFIGVGLARRW